ncbi:photoreceptor cilium actin regulator [Syngnathoides biaculeatus]|uniref:photoreceptor cilium actin regulator n=1 Tax=Syngnathoides biaculeatus TaxID=300417 RepID=UPI002ADD5C91|nr:photoreceptor cilium actin regulator [Syngnathoides biaculeatus]
MGSSPSKGNNLVTLGSLRRRRMLPPAPQDQPREVNFTDGDNHMCTGATDADTKEKRTNGQKLIFQRDVNMVSEEDKCATVPTPEPNERDKLKSQRMNNSTVIQKEDKNGDKQEVTEKKSGRRTRRSSRGVKVLKKKEREMPKIEFPEPLVKAHQAAYAFLNPSINKFDAVLGLLEQATQTQVSLQPMVSFIALRYEEIIQALEEIIDEGEKMLKENSEHLAWPSQMKNISNAAPLKSGSAIEPPPDLLQQLLQYTTQRMQNVSQTVGGIGDSALEEAVEYFSSVSELLEEKLKIKRLVESRLMRLTSHIELASLRKPGPEDSALFSEDSGIGAESESLAGSEKHLRRMSCESSGTNRTTPFSPLVYTTMAGVSTKNLACQISPTASLTSLNSLASMCTMMANVQGDSLLGSVSLDEGEEDHENYKMGRETRNGQVGIRKQFNDSPVNCELQKSRRLPSKCIKNPKIVEMTIKMKNALSGKMQFVQPPSGGVKQRIAGSPKTGGGQRADEKGPSLKRSQTTIRRSVVKTTPVVKERRSRSVEFLHSKGENPTFLELEKSQKKIGQRLQKMNKTKETTKGGTKSTSKENQKTSLPDSPKINQKHPSLENSGNLREKVALMKCTNMEEDDKEKGKESLTGLVKATPPPSPPQSPRPSSALFRGRNSVKKLIDTFSQGIEEMDSPNVLGPLRGVRKCGVPVLPGLGNVTAVLSTGKTSCRSQSTSGEKADYSDLDSLPPPPLEVIMDNSFEGTLSVGVEAEEVLKPVKSPMVKRVGLSQRLRASIHSGPVLPSKGSADGKTDFDPINQIISTPLQQFRKKRYRKHSSDSQSEQSLTNYDASCQSATQEDSTNIQDNENLLIPGINTTVSNVPPSFEASHELTTSLLSKGRILPSTPPTSKSSHRRLPSPQKLKKSPTPPSSASSPVNNRKSSTPLEGHSRLPSPPVKHNILNSLYPLKPPSPPASPKVQRWSRENSLEESARLINNARSVFCPISPSLFEAQPCKAAQISQAWTSVGGSFRSNTCGIRGRDSVSVHGPQPFIRRSLSERRTTLNLQPRSPVLSVAKTCGSEPSICTQGSDDEPARKEESWGSQSDFRATPRSASQPDLYVVGQALHKE